MLVEFGAETGVKETTLLPRTYAGNVRGKGKSDAALHGVEAW